MGIACTRRRFSYESVRKFCLGRFHSTVLADSTGRTGTRAVHPYEPSLYAYNPLCPLYLHSCLSFTDDLFYFLCSLWLQDLFCICLLSLEIVQTGCVEDEDRGGGGGGGLYNVLDSLYVTLTTHLWQNSIPYNQCVV